MIVSLWMLISKKVIKHYKSLRKPKQKFVKQKIQNIVKSLKESVNEYTYGVGDIVKDINPNLSITMEDG